MLPYNTVRQMLESRIESSTKALAEYDVQIQDLANTMKAAQDAKRATEIFLAELKELRALHDKS